MTSSTSPSNVGLKVCILAHFLHALWAFENYLEFLKLFMSLGQIPSKALLANDRELPNHTDRRQLDLLFVRCHCPSIISYVCSPALVGSNLRCDVDPCPLFLSGLQLPLALCYAR